jgi:hypothetical protein
VIPLEEQAEKLLDAIHRLEEVADAVPPEHAHREFDETTLQVFWKQWPDVAAWAGSLWRMLSDELAHAARPHADPELDEIGEAG